MPHPLDRRSIEQYAENFAKFPRLAENGFSFLIDISGKLFASKKPHLKDVAGNPEAGIVGKHVGHLELDISQNDIVSLKSNARS